MEVLSRAWRTDLTLLQHSGSRVERHPTYAVVRTPQNPGFRWGNFLLLRSTPALDEVAHWTEVFVSAFPGTTHRAFGVDDPASTRADLQGFAGAGFSIDASTVLTTDEVRPPPRPNTDAEVRRLASADDWAQRVELALACNEDEPEEGYAEFATRKAAAERRLVEQGAGDWFGAFEDDRMVSGLGIFRAGEGLARYQSVETHPGSRGRGLAGTLVHAAGRHALDQLDARTLVIVADPDYHAIRLYRAAGFTDTETQLGAELASVDGPSD